MTRLFPAAITAVLAGCAPAPPPEDIHRSQSDAGTKFVCNAQNVQSFVGQMIRSATSEQILTQSGAASLRWGPPDSVWTMDYRADRVNVRYDRAMTIADITCG